MNPILYKGNSFASLKALHESYADKGVSYGSFYQRRKAGWKIEDALTAPQQKRVFKTFHVDGKTYPSLAELAQAAGISYLVAVKRCHRGWSDRDIFYGRQKQPKPPRDLVPRGAPVIVGGVQYKNIGQAHASITPVATLNTVKARLRNGWSYEQAFEIKAKIDGRKLRQHRPRGPQKRRQYVAFGVTYKTVASLARAHSVDEHLVYNRIRSGWTAERAVTEPKSAEVTVNGVTYNSAMSAWQKIGKTSFFVFNARKTAGHDLEVCLGLKPIKDDSQVVNGVTFGSLAAVAEAYDIKETVLSGRLNRMSLEEAIVYKPANGRYTAKRFRDDLQLANSPGLLYFVKIKFDGGLLHKIGITQRTIESRFAAEHDFETIATASGRLAKLFEIEQAIIKQFNAMHFRAEEEFEGRTETFLFTAEEETIVCEAIHAKVAPLKSSGVRFSSKA